LYRYNTGKTFITTTSHHHDRPVTSDGRPGTSGSGISQMSGFPCSTLKLDMPAYVNPVNEIGVETLYDEVRKQARAYMAKREEEFWEDAKLRYPTLLASVGLYKLKSESTWFQLNPST
jgi:hypothetical protein